MHSVPDHQISKFSAKPYSLSPATQSRTMHSLKHRLCLCVIWIFVYVHVRECVCMYMSIMYVYVYV